MGTGIHCDSPWPRGRWDWKRWRGRRGRAHSRSLTPPRYCSTSDCKFGGATYHPKPRDAPMRDLPLNLHLRALSYPKQNGAGIVYFVHIPCKCFASCALHNLGADACGKRKMMFRTVVVSGSTDLVARGQVSVKSSCSLATTIHDNGTPPACEKAGRASPRWPACSYFPPGRRL